MKKIVLKIVSSLLGIAFIAAPIHAAELLTQQESLPAGTKKLDTEQHTAIKQKRIESSAEENERGELVTNGMYLTTHPMASHGIYKASPLYDRVELNDGSVWQVWYTSDWSVVSRWMYYNDQVIICPGSIFDVTDYFLVSQRTGEIVPVQLLEMEVIPGDPYFMGQRLWINNITYLYDSLYGCYFYEIRLNDGSIWEVDSRDSYICSYMLPGDVVIIGVDQSIGAPSYNILVHFNTLEYVHADCVAR